MKLSETTVFYTVYSDVILFSVLQKVTLSSKHLGWNGCKCTFTCNHKTGSPLYQHHSHPRSIPQLLSTNTTLTLDQHHNNFRSPTLDQQHNNFFSSTMALDQHHNHVRSIITFIFTITFDQFYIWNGWCTVCLTGPFSPMMPVLMCIYICIYQSRVIN